MGITSDSILDVVGDEAGLRNVIRICCGGDSEVRELPRWRPMAHHTFWLNVFLK